MPTPQVELLGASSAVASHATRGGLPNPCDFDPAPTPSLAVHAAHRLQYGPLPGDIARIESMGYDAFLQEQINPSLINDSAAEAILNTYPRATLHETPAQLYDRRDLGNGENNLPVLEVRHRRWGLRAMSKRQLYEVVVDFWTDHFNVYGFDYFIQSMFPKWENLLRLHALGNFRAFLSAVVTSPVMLRYTGNHRNRNTGPGNQLARVLLEQHTLGLDAYRLGGVYTDRDVDEVGRAFTGWAYDDNSASANRGQFLYTHSQHDAFSKVVLGQTLPAGQPALKDGEDVLDLLAFNPATARNICRKLCVRFIGENPPDSIVNGAADVFMALALDPNQIRSTIFHILNSAEFRDPAYRMTRFKRPLEWMLSMMRALNVTYSLDSDFHNRFNDLGMPTFGWRRPEGPPDSNAFWASNHGLFLRWNYMYRIANNDFSGDGYSLPVDGVAPGSLTTVRGLTQFWSDRAFQRTISNRSLDGLMDFFSEGRNYDSELAPSQITDKLRHTVAMAAMTPEFQWR